MKSITTIIVNPFESSSPQAAMQQLHKARMSSAVVSIPKNERRIDKLLELAPLIELGNGMREKGQSLDFDSAYLPSSPIGSRKLIDETRVIYAFARGILVAVRITRNKVLATGEEERIRPVFEPPQNILLLTPAEKEKLVRKYEEAVNSCDFMLILLYAALMKRKGLPQYEEFILLLDKELKLGKDPLNRMLASLPYTFLPRVGSQLQQHDTEFGLVSRKAQISWFDDVKDIGSFYVFVPIDYCLLDSGASSFYILSTKAKTYKDPESLINYIVANNLAVTIQLYRLGRFLMDTERSEAALYFLMNAEIVKLRRLNHSELVLMGGVLSRDRVFKLVQKIVLAMAGIRKGNEEDDELPEEPLKDRWYRCGILFCFLSASSSNPHCVINIISRESGYNVTKYLYSFVKDEKALNPTLQKPLVGIAFYLMSQLMDLDTTRLHYETIETFGEYRYLIEIDVANPTESRHLDIFKRRYELANRHYITSRKHIGEKGVTTENEPDSIVLMSEDEAQEDTHRHSTSIYLIYNSEGEVIVEARSKTGTIDTDDRFTLLEAERLSSLLKNPSPALKEIREIFDERGREKLTISFIPTQGYTDLYITNLEGDALEDFSRAVKAAGPAVPPKNEQLEELVVKTEEELFRPQTINLLQEEPIKRRKKLGEVEIEELYNFITRQQLRFIAHGAAALREIREGSQKFHTPEEIERIDKEKTWWITSILRLPSGFELYGKAAIEKTVREVNVLRSAYNAAAKDKAPQATSKPQPKRKQRGRANLQVLEKVEDTDSSIDSEEEQRRERERKRQQRLNTQKEDKYKAGQTKKEKRTEVTEQDIQARLLSALQRLTDLIHFATEFESALANFIEEDNCGPLTKEYMANRELTVREKLSQIRAQKVTSVDSILAVYGVRGARNPLITYTPDFSRYNRVVPDAAFIKKHNPEYFVLTTTQIANMVIQDGDQDRARFAVLHLTNNEVIMMAQLQKDEKRQTEFKELIAVLYHMLKTTNDPVQLETHTTIFRRMISAASQKTGK